RSCRASHPAGRISASGSGRKAGRRKSVRAAESGERGRAERCTPLTATLATTLDRKSRRSIRLIASPWRTDRGLFDSSRHVRSNLVIQRMHLSTNALQQYVIVRRQRLDSLLLQVSDPGLDRRLVDTAGGVMVECLDIQRAAQGGKQVILVHLRKPLNRFLVQLLRHVAELCHGHCLEL